MTRDTDRPRRGTDKPGADRPRSPRSAERPSFAGAKPARGGDKKSFGDKPFAKKPFEKKPFEKSSFGDRPARSDKPLRDKPLRAKPDRAERAAPRAIPAAPGDQVATIVQTERQRIAKLMARVGLCSRRDAEAWIVDGRVTLNGAVLTSPAMDVGPEDRILVDGIPLPAAEKTRLFLFHKPRGLVTSDHDPEGRETVADYLAENWPDGPRVVTIGRLDINTEGLLLLTNDGGLARVLELPATGWVRRYRVRAKGETDQGVLDTLRAGIVVDGVDYAGIEAKLDRIQGANCWLTMGLREGKNREIKRVLEHLGLEVNRLIRLSFGPFQLLDLPEGKVEEVKTRILRDQLGETLAAEAGVDFADSEAPIVAAPVPTANPKASRRTDGAKPARRDDTRAPRGDKPERPRRRDDRDEDEVQPIRERPVAGTRRHVSALRGEITTDLRKGPRKRIERSDTTDSNDRRVKVERLVTQRGTTTTEMPRARRGAGRFEGEGKPGRHASPSALAKRERISKSGGVRASAPTERYENRDERLGPLGGAKVRSVRPARDEGAKPFREASFGDKPLREKSSRDRPAREDGGARRSERSAGEEKPWRIERPAAAERPRTGRNPSGDRADSRGPKPDGFKGAKRAFGGKPSGKPSFGGKPARDGDRPRPARGEGGGPRPPGADRAAASARKSGASKPGGRPPARGGAGGKPSKPRAPKR